MTIFIIPYVGIPVVEKFRIPLAIYRLDLENYNPSFKKNNQTSD
jgi:hypothetical protein